MGHGVKKTCRKKKIFPNKLHQEMIFKYQLETTRDQFFWLRMSRKVPLCHLFRNFLLISPLSHIIHTPPNIFLKKFSYTAPPQKKKKNWWPLITTLILPILPYLQISSRGMRKLEESKKFLHCFLFIRTVLWKSLDQDQHVFKAENLRKYW